MVQQSEMVKDKEILYIFSELRTESTGLRDIHPKGKFKFFVHFDLETESLWL